MLVAVDRGLVGVQSVFVSTDRARMERAGAGADEVSVRCPVASRMRR
jgi:hypothetical protein